MDEISNPISSMQCFDVRPETEADEVVLQDDNGPLIWYAGCGTHTVHISPRLAQLLGMSKEFTYNSEA